MFLELGAVLSFGAPGWVRALAIAGIAATAYFTIASIAVSHYGYDRSPLYRWTWVGECLRPGSPRWVNLHAGLDPSTAWLERQFGAPPVAMLDVFDRGAMPQRSMTRAREANAADERTQAARADALPLADASCDVACVVPFAHELREAVKRTALFEELRRVIRPEGQSLVVEHLRDLPNFLAFGPGYLHLLSRRTWLATFAAARLKAAKGVPVNPFVRAFVLERE